MSEWAELPFDRPPARGRSWISVSELTARLKNTIENQFGVVGVEGEVSNCRQWSSGHIYFTLKDDFAQLRAVLFRATVQRLKFKPEEGMRVIARGRLSLYEIKGEYQLVVDALEPHGLGALQAAFEQLKRKLQAEGLFETTRKRDLPVLPRRIGIVTSLDGAAVRDILRILTHRYPTARVVIRPAKVQGFGAAQDLVRALRAIARVPEIDVVIVGRGGGSVEDLWAFNDELLARTIAACPVPVITGIGHEVDFTIADFVADVRAATPSNAAELVVDRADSFRKRIDQAADRLRRAARAAMIARQARRERLELRLHHWPVGVVMRDRDRQELHLRLTRAASTRIVRLAQRVEALRRRLERRDLRHVVAEVRARLLRADGRLSELITRRRLAAEAQVRRLSGQLDALSPLGVLARGYAVCWNDARTSIIRSSSAVRAGDVVRVTLAEGELRCRVEVQE